MEDVMESHDLLDTRTNNGLHCLTEDPQESYPSGICVKLGGKNQDFSSQLCRDSTVLPHELDHIHNFHPFCSTLVYSAIWKQSYASL